MSYPFQPPTGVMAPQPTPAGRPPGVTAASVALWVMAAAGLIYAITTLVIIPGVVNRFQDASGGSFSQVQGSDTTVDYYIAVLWLGAAIALVLGIILLALYVVLGLALRRGSNAARIATLVVCGVGVLAGAGTLVTVAVQRSGNPARGTLGDQLTNAYPGGWIGSNVALAVAQVIGYVLVGLLILTAPAAFFRRPGGPADTRVPTYGGPYPVTQGYAPQGYPGAAGYPPQGYAAGPGYARPGYPQSAAYPQPGDSGYSRPGSAGYGQPTVSGHVEPNVPGYGQPGASGYGQPAATGYGQPAATGYGQPGASDYGQPAGPGRAQPDGTGFPPGYPPAGDFAAYPAQGWTPGQPGYGTPPDPAYASPAAGAASPPGGAASPPGGAMSPAAGAASPLAGQAGPPAGPASPPPAAGLEAGATPADAAVPTEGMARPAVADPEPSVGARATGDVPLSISSALDGPQPVDERSDPARSGGSPSAEPGDPAEKRPAAAPDDEYWSRPSE
jgi:hypothetical protein